ncbi:MAG: hypothetical protein M0D55_17750 [Elusimicrobiota bacterium]|nr:MAG: hypothetical protein M0D55_17750 [Elusimicrobiota bacterium]
MRTIMLAALIVFAPNAGAQTPKINAKDNPEAYWSRGYGCSQTAENYNVGIRVDDVDAMTAKIDVMMTAAGAPSQVGMGNSYMGGVQGRMRQLNYSVPAKGAEKLAKKLLEMGELVSYALNRQHSGDSQKQIEERIAVLEGELANKSELEKMPAARYLLTSKLASLKQHRDICVAGASKSSISINLQSKPVEQKQ